MRNLSRRLRHVMVAGLLTVGMLAVLPPAQASFDSRATAGPESARAGDDHQTRWFRLRNGCEITAERARNSSVVYAFTVKANGRCRKVWVAIVFETCSGRRGVYTSGWQTTRSVEQHISSNIKVIRTSHGGANRNGRVVRRWASSWDGC
jgi:hypothetical protein